MSYLFRVANISHRLLSVVYNESYNVLKHRSSILHKRENLVLHGNNFCMTTNAMARNYHEKVPQMKTTSKSSVDEARLEQFKYLIQIMKKAKGLQDVEGTKETNLSAHTNNHRTNSGEFSTVEHENVSEGNDLSESSHKVKKPRKAKKAKTKSKLTNISEKENLNDNLEDVEHSQAKKAKLKKKQKKSKLKTDPVSNEKFETSDSFHTEIVQKETLSPKEKKTKSPKKSTNSKGGKKQSKLRQNIVTQGENVRTMNHNVSNNISLEMDNLSEISMSVESQKPLWTEDDLRNPDGLKEVVTRISHLLKSDVNQEAKKRGVRIDAERHTAMYLRDVATYADACAHNGFPGMAHNVLLGNIKAGKVKAGIKGQMPEITDVKIFNKILHSWAKQGKLEPMRQLFEFMESEGPAVNFQSYAAVLEACGRQKVMPHDLIHKILDDIAGKGFSIEDICVQCEFHSEEWDCIERVIKSVKPDFLPKLSVATNLHYDCDLLNELNNDKSVPNPYAGVLSTDQLKERAESQKNLELNSNVLIKSIQTASPMNSRTKKARRLMNNMMREKWRISLRNGFTRALQQHEKRKKKILSDIVPYLRLFPTSTYVDIMLEEIRLICQEMESFSPPMSHIHIVLGNFVLDKLIIVMKQKHKEVDKMTELYKEYLEQYNSEVLHHNHRQIMQNIIQEHADGSTLNSRVVNWSVPTCIAVGRFMMSVIMEEVKVDGNLFRDTDEVSEIPAFYSVTRNRNNLPQEEIMPHPVLVRLCKMAELREIQFRVSDLPMLTPPLPWTSTHIGGNILCSTKLVKNAQNHFDKHEKIPNQQLYPVFDALNTVSALPWKVNKPMLDIIIGLFNKGGDPNLDIAPPASQCPAPPAFKSTMTPEEKSVVILERTRLKKKRKEMFSLWCTELYRLSIANKYRDEIFWFPHNIDFRSRFYTVPPHFTHLGSDVSRSLLMFAKGKPLGAEGLDWLKIHLINLTGSKKRAPNQERLEYANSIMDKILDSADNPESGQKWWQKSDEPWQTLACCKEIAEASRSPDPTKYISHLPVHQDGSCNGLQHYAALGRDQSGAESVNLYPFDSPKDVYSDVVELVEKRRAADAANDKVVPKVLKGFVRRKVIKQTIMTTVYGVTKFGARQQIRGQLEDISDFPQDFVWNSMAYLADQTFVSLQQMFTSTKQIQDWYVACAELISRVRYEPVQWVTPVGWPVLQPYYRKNYTRNPENTSLRIIVEKPNVMKQKNAFPPNFIHSLDSTHMMLTAIHCLRQGVNFVAVHDCFWTHASDVNVMNQVCREQFVALHKQPILEDLAAFFLTQYGFTEKDFGEDKPKQVVEAREGLNKILGNLPERGAFDIEKVLESTYFFS